MSRLLLAVSASAAIHKACDLASKLTQAGHEVRVLQTSNAARLVAPQLFQALTGQSARVSEFGDEREGGMDHISLAHWAQAMVFAPVTAAALARLANGSGADLISTVALAMKRDVPRLLCPAMNPTMYSHPAVQRNVTRCCEDGWQLMVPAAGRLACDEEGPGRLPEVPEILDRVGELLGQEE